MRRGTAIGLSALIVAAIPLILIGNALWLLINPWFVEAQYALPGFPEPALALSDEDRTDLAITGMRSIRPGGEGVELLREARLPSGDPAFEQREITHMQDVRSLIAGFLWAWGVALLAALAAVLALRRWGDPGRAGRALLGGALLTVGAMALAGLVMLVDFELLFDGFHGVFFEGDSWRFNETFLLRSLYPDAFWGVAGGVMAALVLAQAGGLILFARRRGHRRPGR